ncbi:gamma-interferon-responsive lysosomal thiol protein-like [Telopea speciosissima]|uniref:gamma-interferon-responsive lysosomal thiol protein-like n=1 Tax=Telopea speciosissima TaxID=54955 RepID=UPI001CC3CC5E|nr:gamma-interferon-responsive lysosomal thiol protein-like [Telopea speciosissima]
MASPRFLFLLLLSYVFVFGSVFNPSSSARVLSSGAAKVSLALYYETLCPFSANFIVKYLPKVYDEDLIKIVDLKLVPYGNAKLQGEDNIACQHGPFECLLNTVEACAIDVWPDLNTHFAFIYCVEHLVKEGKYPEWESCFDRLKLDSKPISECFNSGHGKELELYYANVTGSLQPPHKYVPWVVVDNQPLYEDYENFVTYVCKAYKGNPEPKACSTSLLHQVISVEKAKPTREVCYAEETIKTSASYSS